nr:lysozyme [Rhizobium sp. Q54]
MKITYRVALELASHEGLVRQAYKDSVGVWTWSIGITSASGHSVERYIGNPQPMSRCLEVYVWALEKYAADVRRAFAAKPLTETQFAAALSFHYNTGAIGKASWVKRWLAGDVAGAKKSFMDWSKPAEIIPRRKKERDLFFDGKWSNDGMVTEYTRVKAGGQIDWSSAKRVSIASEMRSVFEVKAGPSPIPTPTPKPANVPPTPTTPAAKPSTGAAAAAGGALALIAAAVGYFSDWFQGLF